jgi:hypothetical protein
MSNKVSPRAVIPQRDMDENDEEVDGNDRPALNENNENNGNTMDWCTATRVLQFQAFHRKRIGRNISNMRDSVAFDFPETFAISQQVSDYFLEKW